MKLTQIDLRDFRCFEHLRLSLEEDVTAVIGLNAAGKTALLDAIALSLLPLYRDIARRRPNAATLDVPTFYRHYAGAAVAPSDIRLNTSPNIVRDGERVSILSAKASFRAGSAKLPVALEWEQEAGLTVALGTSRYSQRWVTPDGLAEAPNGLYVPASSESGSRHIVIPALAYYRDTRDTQFLKSTAESNGRASEPESARYMALDAGASFAEAQRWFYVGENKELRDPRRREDFFWQDKILTAIRGAVTQMLEGIERVYADDDPPRMKARRTDANGLSMVLDFAQLSAGQRNLMALTIDFARRLAMTYPGWDNPLEAPGILLIDEIELNLHPQWQQTVIPHLRRAFSDTQIVVATHSPLVLSTLHSRQIRVLRDQQLFVPSIETYGTDSGRVQRLVMDTEMRPPENPVTERIDRLYREITDDRFVEAERLLAELQTEIDSDDPTLIEARELIETRKWEKEIGL